MKNVDKFRKDFADLRDLILIEIWAIITKQPNWYMQIQDVMGKLTYNSIDFQTTEFVYSVTVKDFGAKGEKAVVWVGVDDEDYLIPVEQLPIPLMINVLEAMEAELVEK